MATDNKFRLHKKLKLNINADETNKKNDKCQQILDKINNIKLSDLSLDIKKQNIHTSSNKLNEESFDSSLMYKTNKNAYSTYLKDNLSNNKHVKNNFNSIKNTKTFYNTSTGHNINSITNNRFNRTKNAFCPNKKLTFQEILNYEDQTMSHSVMHKFTKNFKDKFMTNLNKVKHSFKKTMKNYKKNTLPNINSVKLFTTEIEQQSNDLNDINNNKSGLFMNILISNRNAKSVKNIKSDTTSSKETTYDHALELKKPHKRVRDFKIYIEENNILNHHWLLKYGIENTQSKFNKYLISDVDFQANLIKDEMSLLIENINYYKSNLLIKIEVLNAFKNQKLQEQVKINKQLEETCALINLIPRIILKEYYSYADRFISIAEPSYEYFIKKTVTDEGSCFVENIKLLCKIAIFTRCCLEVYEQLVTQVQDEMILSFKNFRILRAIFRKTRFFMSNIINFGENTLKTFEFDKKIIKKYKPGMDQIFGMSDEKPINFKVTKILEEDRPKLSLENKFGEQLFFRKNEFNERANRVAKALEMSEQNQLTNLKKQKFNTNKGVLELNGPMALINSGLMTKMLKYLKKDVKEKIISLRTIDRFKEMENIVNEY